MADDDPNEVELVVHDEFFEEILADLHEYPELQEAFKLSDTVITPNLPRDDDNFGPGLSRSQRRALAVLRRTLRTVRRIDPEKFEEMRRKLPEDMRKRLDDFLAGKPLSEILPLDPTHFADEHPEAANDALAPTGEQILELSHELGSVDLISEEEDRLIVTNLEFQNWGLTVRNTPEKTLVPKKIQQIIDLVKAAKQNNKRIRAAGYRHTWEDLYSENKEYLISMLDIWRVTILPDLSSITENYQWPKHELNKIELIPHPNNPDLAYIQIGAAATHEAFRRWAIDPRHGASKWTLPLQTLIVELSFGGSNAPICHGAGIRSTTLSDLVTEVQYVDAHGVLREVSNPSLLRAAAGCFGLLGIVTRITLKLERMTAAMFDPNFEDVILAVPPPPNYDISRFPLHFRARYRRLSGRFDAARRRFIATAENKYYSQWLWFPYQQYAFINAWDNSTDTSGWVNYPNSHEVLIQWLSTWTGGVINEMRFFTKLPPIAQAGLMGSLGMSTMPTRKVKTQLINALHFRRGIHNMRVGSFEVNIPIPQLEKNTPETRNWESVQRAWWDALTEMYADRRNVSARIALEMRITADSCVIMAPQAGNSLGTTSIEVVTSMPAVRDAGGRNWRNFKQTLADVWLKYQDADGKPLKARPHWAKEWTDIKVDGKDWVDVLRETHYKEAIEEFKNVLTEIGKDHWTLDDLRARFSNPLLDRLIFGNK